MDALPGDPPDELEAGRQRLRERELPHTRVWFVFFVLWMVAWGLGANWAFQNFQAGVPGAQRFWVFALMVFYLSLCNSFVPMPTAWVVMLAGLPEFSPAENPWLAVLAIAAGGSLGTVAANLNDYHLLAYLFHFGLGGRVKNTRAYAWSARVFDRMPFALLLLVAFVPIPVDVIRWLAVLREYSRAKFAVAYFIGRAVRYALLAACVLLLQLRSPLHVIYIQVGIIVVAVLARYVWRAVRGRPAPPDSAPPPHAV